MGSSSSRRTSRFRGRAPNSGSYPCAPSHAMAASSTCQRICWRKSRRPSPSTASRLMAFKSSGPSRLKITTSSMRFRNSGRKCCRSAPSMSDARWAGSSSARMASDPMLDVMMMTLWRKSTVRPDPSVSRPSSRTCRRMFQTSGWAFSTSSSKMTAYGRRRMASVSCPPSS